MLIYWKIEQVSTSFIWDSSYYLSDDIKIIIFGSKLTMQSGLFFNSVIMVDKSNMAD